MKFKNFFSENLAPRIISYLSKNFTSDGGAVLTIPVHYGSQTKPLLNSVL